MIDDLFFKGLQSKWAGFFGCTFSHKLSSSLCDGPLLQFDIDQGIFSPKKSFTCFTVHITCLFSLFGFYNLLSQVLKFWINTHPEFPRKLNDQTQLFLPAVSSLSPTHEPRRQETPHHIRNLYRHHCHYIWKQVVLHHEGHLLLVLGKSLQNKPCGSEWEIEQYFAKTLQMSLFHYLVIFIHPKPTLLFSLWI